MVPREELPLGGGLPVVRAVKTKASRVRVADIQTEENYAVSPSTPLLSTQIAENSFVCGSNKHAQLGVTGVQLLHEPQLIEATSGEAGRWASLAFGSMHAAGLTCSGQLLTWGVNTSGQLGHTGDIGSVVHVPMKVESPAQIEYRALACGDEHTVVATGKGVLACGSNASGQLGFGENSPSKCMVLSPIPALHNMMVVQVACGKSHTMCVTAQSQVFAWGANDVGQLGVGDLQGRHNPSLVDALWALPVVQLAAGDSHSLALTSNGSMFAWGSNQHGQLGLRPDAEHTSAACPAKQRDREPSHVLVKSSGATLRSDPQFLMSMMDMGFPRAHAELALDETGNLGVEVATEWLCSVSEQVLAQHLAERGPSCLRQGTGALRDEVCISMVPRRVPLKNVRHVAAGRFHTVAISDSGAFSWGSNCHGALGHGDTQDRDLPCKVEALVGDSITRVACGASHTLFLSQNGYVYGCGECSSGQLTQRTAQMGISEFVTEPVKLALPFGVQRSKASECKAPVVHDVVCGPKLTAFITRAPDELPEVHRPLLLQRLQSAIERVRAQQRRAPGEAKQSLDMTNLFKAVSSGVESVFSSPAAISAAFGYSDGVGLDVKLLDTMQQSILDLYGEEKHSHGAGHEQAGNTLADLHMFSICQTMFSAATTLLEDLGSHSRLLGSPERAQVLLAAFQHPLLRDHTFAKHLFPRLGALFINAPAPTRQLLVKWWSSYPPDLLLKIVVKPLQSYLTTELMVTKKLTVSVMNAIKVLAKVEEANQIGRLLPPEAFYNQLISDKMDVQDHYTAWRQTHDMPATKRHSPDGPFSFCSYPFLLDPRAKSNLLHIEARFQMEQTVAHARMEQQLYGGSNRPQDDDSAMVLVKSLSPGRSGDAALRQGSNVASSSSSAAASSSGRTAPKRSSSSTKERSLRGLLLGLFRRSRDDVIALVDPVPPSKDSFSLPSPSQCTMPGTHSDMCIVRVRRTRLVEDALSEISRQWKKDLFKPLRVHFIGEEGIDAGGVKKEFFQLLVTEMLSQDYGMLLFQSESNTYWFNANSWEDEDQYLLLGLILGLAVYNRVLLDFPLPLALYKKLLGLPMGLRDLEDMQPTFGRSLRQVLQYDGAQGPLEEVFCLDFTLEDNSYGEQQLIQLVPHGREIPVTEDNRLEYVEAVVDMLLNKSVAKQFNAFAMGFRILCDGPAIRLFNAQELERLVCGNPNLDFDALQSNAKYEGGYHAGTQAVQWLWDIVTRELILEEKKKFLKFFTGSDRAPIGGLGTLRCIIQRNGVDSNKLPTSHTCFNTLLLPEYCSREKLLTLLRVAITCCTGFGLE